MQDVIYQLDYCQWLLCWRLMRLLFSKQLAWVWKCPHIWTWAEKTSEKANGNLTGFLCTSPNMGTLPYAGQLFCKMSWSDASILRHTGEGGRWARCSISARGENKKSTNGLYMGDALYPHAVTLSICNHDPRSVLSFVHALYIWQPYWMLL